MINFIDVPGNVIEVEKVVERPVYREVEVEKVIKVEVEVEVVVEKARAAAPAPALASKPAVPAAAGPASSLLDQQPLCLHSVCCGASSRGIESVRVALPGHVASHPCRWRWWRRWWRM